MSGSYPNLGFDPAPGNPGTVDALRANLAMTMRGVESARGLLASISQAGGIWEGEAASAFSDKMSEFPRYLRAGRDSLSRAVPALQGWHGQLVDFQGQAHNYERLAAEARKAIAEAETRYQQARRHPDLDLAGQYFPTEEQLRAAEQRLQAAQAQLAKARDILVVSDERLQEIIRKAKKLKDEHEDAARRWAEIIEGAAEDAPRAPDLFKRLAEELGEFFADAKEWLDKHAKQIGDILGIASAIIGVISLFVPFLAPLAIGLGAAALAFHAYDALRDGKITGGEALTLATDVLGVVPAIKPIAQAAKGVKAAAAAGDVKGATGVAKGMWKGVDELTGGDNALSWSFKKATEKALQPVDVSQEFAMGTAKKIQAGFDTSLQVPSIAEAAGHKDAVSEEHQTFAKGAGFVRAGESTASTYGPDAMQGAQRAAPHVGDFARRGGDGALDLLDGLKGAVARAR